MPCWRRKETYEQAEALRAREEAAKRHGRGREDDLGNLVGGVGRGVEQCREVSRHDPRRVARRDRVDQPGPLAAQRLIDPVTDLARVEDGLARAEWILPAPSEPPPLHRPLRLAVRP